MAHRYSCGCLFNMFNLNVKFLIMANRDKFLHNINKAKRQREIKQDLKDLQADKLRHMENIIAVRKMVIRHEHQRDLLEQKFLKSFDPFNTSNLKEDE